MRPMERLVAAYRVSSSRVALAALVGGNLVPLVGVLFLGWNLLTILVLYWLENGIVGAFNALKMLMARGDPPGIGSLAGRLGMTAFFGVHYGIFWTVHGVFVWTALPMFLGMGAIDAGDAFFGPAVSNAPDRAAVFLGAIALGLSHGASFLFNYLGRGEYLRTSAARQMFSPYGRVVVLHLTILGGGIVGAALGSSLGILLILVLLKTALDAGFHLREHRS